MKRVKHLGPGSGPKVIKLFSYSIQLSMKFNLLFGILTFIRPKEKYASFPVTCPKFLGSVGRQTFLYGKSMKILKNSLKIDFNIPKLFKKV